MIFRYNQFITESVDLDKLKNKTSLFSKDSGFDTPKKLNRSDEIVPRKILDEIEKGITLERLDSLNLPIFKYKTQITIHGMFDKLTTQRIGGYKLLFQNKNKSIGVKWNAIDFEKKREIYSVMKHFGYSITYNSNEFYATKNAKYDKENYKKLKKEYDKIDDSLFIGSKNIFVGEIAFLGKYLILQVNINAIPAENVWKLITNVFDINQDEWKEIKAEKKRKSDEEREKMRIESEERDKQRKIEIDKKIEEYKDKYKVVDSFEDIPTNDCILLYLDSLGYEYLIKKYTTKGKTVYQHIRNSGFVKGSGIEEINQRLKKFDITEDKVKKIFLNNVIFLVKEFGKIMKPTPEPKIKRFDTFEEPLKQETPANIQVLDYSDRAVIVIGDTKSIKDILKNMGGRFNKFLKHPDTGEKVVGWVFPKTKKDALLKLIS